MKPYEPYTWKEEIGAWLIVVMLMGLIYFIIQAYENHDVPEQQVERKVQV